MVLWDEGIPLWLGCPAEHAPKKYRLAENLIQLVSWLGNRYRKLIKAWWFDSPYSLDRRNRDREKVSGRTSEAAA
jgi:hypothetical protein